MEAHSLEPRAAPDSLIERLRSVHLQMVDAVLGGDGLEQVAELAAAAAGGPVAIVIPRLGAVATSRGAAADAVALRRYVAERVKDRPAPVPPGVAAEVPIAWGDDVIGGVLMLAAPGEPGTAATTPEATEFLHLAAVASLTEVAVEEAKEEVEQNLRGSFLEDLRSRPDLDAGEIARRAGRLGCDLARGAVVLCAELTSDRPRHVVATIGGEYPGALAQHMDAAPRRPAAPAAPRACTRCCRPPATTAAARPRPRWRPPASSPPASSATAPSACRASTRTPASLVARSRRPSSCSTSCGARTSRSPRTSAPAPTGSCSGCWPRTPRRSARSTRTPSRRSSSTTTSTPPTSSGTLEAYLEQNCNMNATAAAIYAHRHTVAYRLERVKELCALDPMQSEDRERLGLGLKAYRIIAPRLPR